MDLQAEFYYKNFKPQARYLSLRASKTGKPQVEFRYEISDRNSPRQNFTMEFRLEFYGKTSI